MTIPQDASICQRCQRPALNGLLRAPRDGYATFLPSTRMGFCDSGTKRKACLGSDLIVRSGKCKERWSKISLLLGRTSCIVIVKSMAPYYLQIFTKKKSSYDSDLHPIWSYYLQDQRTKITPKFLRDSWPSGSSRWPTSVASQEKLSKEVRPKTVTSWWFQPLWKILVNWDDDIPNIWENKIHVPVTTNQIY